MALFKRCSNCEHCVMDLRALYVANVFRRICAKHKHWVKSPFWEGWKCKDWRSDHE
jgi:hypothetical protein